MTFEINYDPNIHWLVLCSGVGKLQIFKNMGKNISKKNKMIVMIFHFMVKLFQPFLEQMLVIHVFLFHWYKKLKSSLDFLLKTCGSWTWWMKKGHSWWDPLGLAINEIVIFLFYFNWSFNMFLCHSPIRSHIIENICFIHVVDILVGYWVKFSYIPNINGTSIATTLRLIFPMKFECFESMWTFEFVDPTIGKSCKINNVQYFNKLFSIFIY
jgi:hypothetical protein